MDWYIASPFIQSAENSWLVPFVKRDLHRLIPIPAAYHHNRLRAATGVRDWLDYVRHGLQTRSSASRSQGHAGVITCFPQLPLVAGLQNRLPVRHIATVAWCFNLGALPRGMKHGIAKYGYRGVDRFIVHSRAEVRTYSEWLGLPESRFSFVPLQCPQRERTLEEERHSPFLLSMGSAKRDYQLLFSVLEELRYPAVVVCAPHAIADLTVPANVQVLSGLTPSQCHELLQRARVSVTPLANNETASGQVTILDAMMFGCASVVTACPGTVDYLTHGTDALLVHPGSRDELKSAVRRVWEDKDLRRKLTQNARRRVQQDCSDAAAARALQAILDDVESQKYD